MPFHRLLAIVLVATPLSAQVFPEKAPSSSAPLAIDDQIATPVPSLAASPIAATPIAPASAIADLSGTALLERVEHIAANGRCFNPHKNIYVTASRYLFSVADNRLFDGRPGIRDAYSEIFIPGTSAEAEHYTRLGDKDRDGYSRAEMTIEHLFPQSFFDREYPMRSDLHHLIPALNYSNSIRGSLPFGTMNTSDYREVNGSKLSGYFFEPPDRVKGRVARSMLYFFVRYKDEAFFDRRAVIFWNSQIETLLDWNRRFPPTIDEKRRNDQVEAFQGNRNPFADDWTLADRIGAEAFRAHPSLTEYELALYDFYH